MIVLSEGRRLTAEFLGTALLLAAIVGSGITAASSGGPSAQLFQHAMIVGLALAVLIATFGPVSGAHLNPAVTAVDWWFGGLPGRRALLYVAVQVAGAVSGTVATHLMFGLPAVALSATSRSGLGLAASEVVATAGLLLVIFALVRAGNTGAVPAAVGAWIGGAIFFTSSAAFANPVVTLARGVTGTYTGIAPASVPAFLIGQLVGTVVAALLIRWLYAPDPAHARAVIVPHEPSVTERESASVQGVDR